GGELARGPATAAEIADGCNIDPDDAVRLLEVGASLGFIDARKPPLFSRTPMLDTLRRDVVGPPRSLATTVASIGVHCLRYARSSHEQAAAVYAVAAAMNPTIAKEVVEVLDLRSARVLADISGSTD